MPKKVLCFWQAVLWAKEKGCSTFDLGGYLPDTSDPSIQGINQFKLGFSKVHVDLMPELEIVISPQRYRFLLGMAAVAKAPRSLSSYLKKHD